MVGKPAKAPMARGRLLALVLAYYVASTLTSCLTKQLLQDFPRPVTVSLVQQIFAMLGGAARVSSPASLLRNWRMVLPVALTLIVSVVLYRISLLYNSLSFAQAIKTLQPLFAAMLSSVLLHERISSRRLASLLLLLCGVGIATTTELSFSSVGFACTVAACFAQALQAVLSKSLLVHTQLPPEEVFASAATLTLLLLLPIWVAVDAPSIAAGEPPHLLRSGALRLLLLNGVCNLAAQLLSFAVLCAVVSPVSAAVVSTFKRVVTIVCAVLWFGTPVTAAHAFGICVAIGAVTLYEEKHRTPEAATPHVQDALSALPLSLALNPRRSASERQRLLSATERRPACCREVV